jgi:hypothetical protein
MDFWKLLAQQTNLKSVYDMLHSLKTTAVEIIHLTRVGLVMEQLIHHRLNYN